MTAICLSSEGPFLAVGTAAGNALLFHTHELLRDSRTRPSEFAVAVAASPLTCVSFGSAPLLRVYFQCTNGGRTAGTQGAPPNGAIDACQLVALGADGSLCGAQLDSKLVQSFLTCSRRFDKKTRSVRQADTWRVLAANPPPLSVTRRRTPCSNAPLLSTAQLERKAVAIATCCRSGVFQLWLLPLTPTSAAASKVYDANASTLLTLHFSW